MTDQERYEWAKQLAYSHTNRARAVGAEGEWTAEQWLALCRAYGNKCALCGTTPERLSPDHIEPVSKGGHNYIWNILPVCWECNNRKSTKSFDRVFFQQPIKIEKPKVQRNRMTRQEFNFWFWAVIISLWPIYLAVYLLA